MSRAANLHQARVYLTESKRRGRSSFAFLLLIWAWNARRRAATILRNRSEWSQGDLFEVDHAHL